MTTALNFWLVLSVIYFAMLVISTVYHLIRRR